MKRALTLLFLWPLLVLVFVIMMIDEASDPPPE